MKKANENWSKRYTVTTKDGEKITASAAMLTTLAINMYEAANNYGKNGLHNLERHARELSREIDAVLIEKGYLNLDEGMSFDEEEA